MSNRFYEMLGRAAWAIAKRRVAQKMPAVPAGKAGAVGALAIGVIGLGAFAARRHPHE